MPSFDSPIGGKKFVGQQMREFDVPDETELQQMEQESNNPVVRRRAAERAAASLEEQQAAYARQQAAYYESQQDDEAFRAEREFREAREAKRTGKTRLSDGARKRIEMLLGMTRTTREVDINGNLFVLQSLRSEEMRDAWVAAAEYDGTVHSPFEIRKQLLARSLVTIAGVDAAQFLGSNDLGVKMEAIELFDHALLSRLHEEYSLLVEESRKKYAVKTEEDVKEIVEELKK